MNFFFLQSCRCYLAYLFSPQHMCHWWTLCNHHNPFLVAWMAYQLQKNNKCWKWSLLTKTSEVLRSILVSILGLKSFFWDHVMTDWMFFTNGFWSWISVRLSEQIFTDESLDMSCVTWDLLISNLVVWATNPIFRKSAHVSEYNFIFINLWNEIWAIQSWGLIFILILLKNNWMNSIVRENLSFNLACGRTESFVFRWDMSSVSR